MPTLSEQIQADAATLAATVDLIVAIPTDVASGMTRSSTTSLTPGAGSKSFTFTATNAYTPWGVGSRVKASSAAAPTTKWMSGIVTAESSSALTMTVDDYTGGAAADWTLALGGEKGATGATGPTGPTGPMPDLASPGPIGFTTPAAARLTDVAATSSLEVGAIGSGPRFNVTAGALVGKNSSDTMTFSVNSATGAVTCVTLTVGSGALVMGGNVTFSGAYAGTFTLTGTTTLTLPTSGTLATTATEAPRLVAWDTGSAVYVRMAYDATNDLVVKFVRTSGTNSNNMNFTELGLLLKTTPSTGTPTLGTSLESFADDTTGYLTAANGRFGGNHMLETVELTKAAHGLTGADIGKRYDDTNSREYAITRIISSSVIEVIPEPALSVLDPTGTKTLPPAASTLTGLDGLSNLTGWTAAYAAAGPGMNGLVQYFLLDGVPLVPFGPALSGTKLEILEYHQAPNAKGAFAYFVANPVTGTWANAGKMWDRVTRTTFHPWGQMEVEDGCLIAYETRFSEANPLQFNPLLGTSGSTNMHVLVPGTASITFTGSTVNSVANPTLNFNTPIFVGGTCSGTDIAMETSSHSVLSGGVFPDWLVQMCSNSTSSHSGWTVAHLAGLDPTYAGGVPAARSASSKEWFRLQLSSRKTYAPQVMSKDSTFAAATAFQHRAFRRWQAAHASSPVDFWTFVKAGEKWLVYAAWTTSPGAFTLTLPGYLASLAATAVRVHNAALTSTTSTGGLLTITPSAANGHAIIQLG